jgi:hypothetical protein
MRWIAWMLGVLALPLGGCEYNTLANGLGYSYLIDSQAQIPDARQQADDVCGKVERRARLSNITQFQHVLVVFDCQPPEDVRFEEKPYAPPS